RGGSYTKSFQIGSPRACRRVDPALDVRAQSGASTSSAQTGCEQGLDFDQPVGQFGRIRAALREMLGEHDAPLAHRLGPGVAGPAGADRVEQSSLGGAA